MAPVHYHAGKFPPKVIDWERLIPLVGPTSAAIARYEGVLEAVPNPDVLLSPLTTNEAVLSSRIEGTQATLGEVLEFEAAGAQSDASGEKRADINEVLNYRAALYDAVDQLGTLPLSQRVVRDAHRRLMRGVRGDSKTPGEYRRTPVWLGAARSPIEAARFVPIGADRIPDAMSAWERYLHADEPDRLVQLAMAHAEFEAIHPFLDGNGRIGRLLIPLFLVEKGILGRPTFYMSGYLEANRDEYYDRLLAVSRDADWTGWAVFFLTAMKNQAEENGAKARAILDLYRREKEWITRATRSQHAIAALDWVFSRPIFSASDFVSNAGIPRAAAKRILSVAREAERLRELRPSSGRRPAILAFPGLLNIAEGRAAF
jgi:cell filamentation protein, protein adenylyltransferase